MPAHRLWMKSGASGRAIDFQHTAINQNENHDIQRGHGKADKDRLEPQAQKGTQPHCLQRGLQIRQHIRRNIRGALDHPRRACNHALRHIKNRVDDIECVGEDKDGRRRFENPLEKHPSVDVV